MSANEHPCILRVIPFRFFILLVTGLSLMMSAGALAGDPNPSVPPGTPTMKTLDQIYDKLDTIDGKLGGSGTTGSYGGVQATGQTQSYREGDDAWHGAGVSLPANGRFTNNGDGTITDNLTGLIWLRKNFCTDLKDLRWDQAIDAVNALHDVANDINTDCGLSDGSVAGDWRLANINELASLTDRGLHQGAVPVDFRNYFVYDTAVYWSSTTVANTITHAWVLWQANGGIYTNEKTADDFVPPCFGCTVGVTIVAWPVRGPE